MSCQQVPHTAAATVSNSQIIANSARAGSPSTRSSRLGGPADQRRRPRNQARRRTQCNPARPSWGPAQPLCSNFSPCTSVLTNNCGISHAEILLVFPAGAVALSRPAPAADFLTGQPRARSDRPFSAPKTGAQHRDRCCGRFSFGTIRCLWPTTIALDSYRQQPGFDFSINHTSCTCPRLTPRSSYSGRCPVCVRFPKRGVGSLIPYGGRHFDAHYHGVNPHHRF